MERDRKF